jgi:dihydrolipoamide dehydrogenase
MSDIHCKLLVIGAGPGGYACAIRAGQLGIDTVIVERNKIGGTCLNIGCIPSKALIHAADEFHRIGGSGLHPGMGITAQNPGIDWTKTIAWKDAIVSRLNKGVKSLLKKNAVRHIAGRARFVDGKTVEAETDKGRIVISAQAIVIATGSAPMALEAIPFGGPVMSSAGILSCEQIPQTLSVIGGGYIGLEIGTAFAKLGSAVTIIESEESILPQYDRELVEPVTKMLEKLDVKLLKQHEAIGYSGPDRTLKTIDAEQNESTIAAENVLVAVGRKPSFDGLGLEELALPMNGPFIAIDDRCRTAMNNVYAIGDVTGAPLLAHRATAQGVMVAEIIAGSKRTWNQACIPEICFTDPEIVSVGLSASAAAQQQIETVTGKFPFAANGRALSLGREDGMIRVTARAEDHIIIGIHGVGAGISELSGNFALAIEMGARLEDVAGTIFAHPTLAEAFHEASLDGLDMPLHK